MSSIVEQIIAEHEENKRNKKMLTELKEMFEFAGNKHESNFILHMQKWKDAQPLTNMTIIEKLDKLCNKADEVAGNSSSYEEEVSRALSALEDVPYDLSHDAYGLQDDIKALMKEIKEPKEQAETDMEDSE